MEINPHINIKKFSALLLIKDPFYEIKCILVGNKVGVRVIYGRAHMVCAAHAIKYVVITVFSFQDQPNTHPYLVFSNYHNGTLEAVGLELHTNWAEIGG